MRIIDWSSDVCSSDLFFRTDDATDAVIVSQRAGSAKGRRQKFASARTQRFGVCRNRQAENLARHPALAIRNSLPVLVQCHCRFPRMNDRCRARRRAAIASRRRRRFGVNRDGHVIFYQSEAKSVSERSEEQTSELQSLM